MTSRTLKQGLKDAQAVLTWFPYSVFSQKNTLMRLLKIYSKIDTKNVMKQDDNK